MALIVTVISQQGIPTQGAPRVALKEQDATLGRGSTNELVLPDPRNSISRTHAKIDYRSGAYHITDTSLNGVFLNESSEPLGKGNSAKLKDGDRIRIGDYLIEVTLSEDELGPAVFDTPDISQGRRVEKEQGSFWNGRSTSELEQRNSYDAEAVVAPDWFKGERQQPSEPMLSKPPEGGTDGSPRSGASSAIPPEWFKDEIPTPENETSRRVEETSGEPSFPDSEELTSPDWFNDKQQAPNQPMEPPDAELDLFRNWPTNSPKEPSTLSGQGEAPFPHASDAEASLSILLSAAGLPRPPVSPASSPQVLALIGRILRETMRGILAGLAARSAVKGDLYVPGTRVVSTGNNPLKLSVSPEEALERLLVASGEGYLPPVQAVQEAFDDIHAHQLAMWAGMKAALTEVLRRFDPEELEVRVGQGMALGGLRSGQRKAKSWERFGELYAQISQEAEEDFYKLFREQFATAYLAQVHRLRRRRLKSQQTG